MLNVVSMNSKLVSRFRSLRTTNKFIDSINRPNKRCVHKCVVHCQEEQKEIPNEMKEYWKRRERLLASNPVKYSTEKASKWDMKTMGTVSKKVPFHRSMSAIFSLIVLIIYLIKREENDLDEGIMNEGKTAEEFQEYLNKLKEKKERKR
ncbi:uncharacterized protein LOC117334623 [Pecten maximus]|uniref:uncharacterized protein LOC117334623 n=1 Tax=Pecten maximus TaxID=6579 RepID=UPI001458EC37|nr:uncharacterized protein LOC117334623 [Pecten maximus]